MKHLIKLINIAKSKRGEMLLESVLSLFILTLIVTAAGAMVATATAIGRSSEKYSTGYYTEYGKVLKGESIPSSDKTEMKIKITYSIDGKTNDLSTGKLPDNLTEINKDLTVTNGGIMTIK